MKHHYTTHLNFTRILGRLCLLGVLSFFISPFEMRAQNLKALGNGVPDKVYCGCTDTSGNVYVVTQDYGDTTYVRKWNISSKSWSVYAKLSDALVKDQFSAQCIFLKSKFYIAAEFTGDLTHHQVWEYNGSSWTYKDRLRHAPAKYVSVIRFDSMIYFAGSFDSLTSGVSRQVVKFDGTTFSSTGASLSGLIGSPAAASLAISNDTLFMTYGTKILFHKAPGTWGVYYAGANSLRSIAIANNDKYASDWAGNIATIRNGARIDSFQTSKLWVSLVGYKNRVFLTHRKGNYSYAIRFGEFKNKKIDYYFHNTYMDTMENAFINHNNQALYYFSRHGVFSSGVDYHHIARFNDSGKALAIDTILVKVFKDKNRNYAFDTTEQGTFRIWEHADNESWLTNSLGELNYYPLEDEDYSFSFLSEFPSGDSCYATPYSGVLSSRTYNSPRTKDTLYMPLWRKTTQQNNLILRSWSGNRARMLDTIPLVIAAYHGDCDPNIRSATVKVTLEGNTDFISSVPMYNSKSGNVLTYNLSIDPSVKSFIKIKVVYPNTKYVIGQKARHYARLTTTFSEDTMDNMDSIVQLMSYSYDPNAKHCIPEGHITKDLKTIRYHIDFQNLGNDVARRVTIVDTLNLKMPVYQFQMVASSHDYGLPSLRGNVVTWTFENINLKPKMADEAASKGYLIFDAHVRGDLKQGDSIRNKAYIYFDYNEPVITNYAVITRKENFKSIEPIAKPYTLIVYPNPANHYLTVKIDYIGDQDITIYDAKGALIHEMSVKSSTPVEVSTSHWARGIYLVVSSSGESVKVVIE